MSKKKMNSRSLESVAQIKKKSAVGLKRREIWIQQHGVIIYVEEAGGSNHDVIIYVEEAGGSNHDVIIYEQEVCC
ncbi:receptor-like protein kinase-like [Dorcoceras hygrometricum]|uniref:Receptor-like protein kinase-like n=1 Tax=Dorcoceras hygrometricum TaxID=472368 RepID=A0A2Z7ALP0_9LAMI|nr:receptor-like protein kinase-like [Dorcoceras hygrometricum]